MHPEILIIKGVLFIRSTGPRLLQWALQVGWWKAGAGVLATILIVGGGLVFINGSPLEAEPTETIHSVEVKSVSELSSATTPLSLVGAVSSKSEATVRTEKSGQVVGVYKALGDSVSAGAVVAEIENASERAMVLQAEGVVDGAKANLAKVSGGVRSEQRAILETNVANAEAALDSARSNAVSTLLSAYASIDNGIRGTTDKMFTNPSSNDPHFTILVADFALTAQVESTRTTVSQYLARQTAVSNSVTPLSDLSGEITTTQSEVRAVRAFLDMVVSALNKGIQSPSVSTTAIATYLAEAIAVRTSLTSTLTALGGATQSLAGSQSALDIARKNLEQGLSGGQAEDVSAAQAALKQAQGALAGARANLEKAIIRAPISGTINSFSLKRGDYVQTSSPVLTIGNNGSLEVAAYVSENDARELAVGQSVSIEQARGMVTRIAPALDPTTKKIEVRIGVNDPEGLINGQSVLVSIMRSRSLAGEADRITIPISAIKVESDRVSVFTVEEGVLLAHTVTLGALLGERVVVSTGLTEDMRIVTDARGLREGERVEISVGGK